MRNLLIVLFLSALCFVTAKVELSRARNCVIEKSCKSHDWTLADRAKPTERIELLFAIKQKNLDKLEKTLYDVSDPRSKNYGKHLTLEEVGQLVSDPVAEKAVRLWLRGAGIPERDLYTTKNKDFIRATISVRVAERLFSTEFFNFVSTTEKKSIIRTLRIFVPNFILLHLDLVSGTTQFPPHVRRYGFIRSHNAIDESKLENGYTTPALINSYYQISSNAVTNSQANQSLFESLGQSFSPSDLAKFETEFKLPSQAVSKVVGSNSPSQCTAGSENCVEANLDVQYIIAVAQAPTWFWSVPSTGDIFLAWIQQVADTSDAPIVHSISYGSIESDEDPTSAARFSTEAQKLGVRGMTIMVASGDDGVANFIARGNPSECGFNPSYPATCPYVTAVGATQGPEDGTAEIMCSSSTNGLITSGGGFSNIYATPSFQTTQVASYLKNGPKLPPKSDFNTSGRAYPDVAVLGHCFIECEGGEFFGVSGTSAASPTFAGMVTLINNMRLKAGKSALGWLNPALYQLGASTPSAFHDITSGTNNCCAGETGSETCCTYGFTAGTGWDPTTGFGSPVFPSFSAALN